MNIRSIIKDLIPPIIIKLIRKSKRRRNYIFKKIDASKQELDLYWSEDMASQLEKWGESHTWIEIECLLVNCGGKVLDIACGTGVNIINMQKFTNLEIHGFDISDYLISKAIAKGVDKNKLKIMDATKTDYMDNEFDYSYSIGSLEHFTEEGIERFLKECSRYTFKKSFHMIPVSASGLDEGWMRTNQSFFNNSEKWWLSKFEKYFKKVIILKSGYYDTNLSVGRWFVCEK